MATLKKELRDILDRYEIDYRDKDKLWDCHGTLVLYHKAYEQIAAKEKIIFDPPMVLEANSAAKCVALCVMARMGDRSEWATGEAAPGNNKNAYPYAMAEKRAKDRAVAKLVGLAAYVLSEDEADDFKEGERKPVEDAAKTPANKGETSYTIAVKSLPNGSGSDWPRWKAVMLKAIEQAESIERLSKLMKDNEAGMSGLKQHAAPAWGDLNQVYTAKRDQLSTKKAA